MHICLPDTREVKPQHGSAYLLYNVHIDGLYHCSFRYKQLLHLHKALLKQFTSPYHQLPNFPPKKLLPLSANQVEERRIQLEKYLQSISQDKAILNSSIFNLFLLEAQRESTRIRRDQVHLDIELVNGQKIRLQVFTHDSADAVLTAVCRALGLNDRYHAYFCLCLCGYDVVRDKLIIKRRLSFFESPYVTLQMAIQQQEQLHQALTSNRCNCYLTTSDQAQLTAMPATAAALTNNCQCLSCLNHPHNHYYNNHHNNNNNHHHQHHQQHQQSNCNLIASNGVPLVSPSSESINDNLNDHLPGQYNSNSNSNKNTNHGNNNIDICSSYNSSQYQSNQTCYYHHQSYRINQSQDGNFNQMDPSTSTTTTTAAAGSTTTTTSFVTHRILLRKSYWDPIYDTYILNDQQALNLLFIQTVYDMKHSLMFVNRETYHQLESLLESDSKLEYILLARTLKYYNYVHFEPCLSDYPRPRTKVMISIGSKELNMRVLKSPRSLAASSSSSASTNATTTTTTTTTTTRTASAGNLSVANATSIGSSSNSSSSSSSSSSSVSSMATNNSTNHAAPPTIQQVKVPNDQILYCTSSLVPSGYRHLITKDDLVEEEYNFKVPLIRCWRLTSLETLNSNPAATAAAAAANDNNNNNTLSHVENVRRKTLSLLNSLSISNSTNSSSPNVRQPNQRLGSDAQAHHHHQNGRGTLLNSGSGGASLLAALAGTNTHFNQHCQPQNHHKSNHGAYQSDSRAYPAAAAAALNHHQQTVQPFSQYELSFEYLISKDRLRWITISSDQAIFISISLQGVVDELVSKRDGSDSLYQSSLNDSPVVDCQMMARNGQNHSSNPNHHHHLTASANQSFTYMYRDGTQKTLSANNQQLIDKFGTTLGYSPMNPNVLALARQRQQQQSSRSSMSLLSSASRFAFLGNSSDTSGSGGQQSSSLEISNLKKAPSPIINDAFEGVTNDEDL